MFFWKNCNLTFSNKGTQSNTKFFWVTFIPNTIKLDSRYQQCLFRNVSQWNRRGINDNQQGYIYITPHEEGIETMEKYLNLRENQSVSTNSLCNLAHIILIENYFEIGKDMYHQNLGTAGQ